MKTVIYTRVSTASQIDGTSLESQERECRSLAPDADVVKEIYSGAYLYDRPELSRLRDQIKAGTYSRIICYTIDRLSRSISHLMILMEEFERYNVSLEFVTETLDNTPEGKLLQSVKGYVAEVEREKIRERTMRGRRTAALNGTLSHKRKLFGYEIEDGRVVKESEARVVRRLYETICNGTSLRELAKQLNSENVRTPHGSKTWWPHSIKSIVNNPAYCGRTTVFRYKHEIKYVAGKRKHHGSKMADSSAQIILYGVTPPIVSVEQWDAAQKALQTNRKKRKRDGQREYLLRGLVRCANCGRQYSPVGKRKYRYYVCTSTQNPSIHCRTKLFPAGKHEDDVWKDVCKMIRGSKPRKRKVYDPTPTIAKHQARLEKEIETLIRRASTVDEQTWQVFQSEISAKREEIARLEQEKPKSASKEVDIAELRRKYRDSLDDLSFEKKVELLRALKMQFVWDGKELLTVIE